MLDPLSVNIPLATPRPTAPTYPTRKLLQPSPSNPNDYILEIDYSSWSMFMKCPRMWENYAIRSREADKDRSATDFGGLFHDLEQLRLLHGITPEIRAQQANLITQHFLQHPVPPTDYRTADMMTSVYAAYLKTYSADSWPDKILEVNGEKMVERPFKVELMTLELRKELPYRKNDLVVGDWKQSFLFVRNLHILFTGRIDVVLTEGEMLWVVDHKTTSRGGREFEEYFRLSMQTRGYAWAAQKLLSREITGLILNAAIVRAPTRTGKGTEFLRRNYFYSQDSLVEWEECAKAGVSDIVSALVRGYFPQYAQSFISPCCHCEYNENCTLPRSQRAADLASNLYRDVTWNPIH